MGKIKLGIVFGGKSAEHEVSLMSVSSVLKVINRERYEITLFYISKCGRWLIFTGDEKSIINLNIKLTGPPIKKEILERLYNIDIMLPIIHGPDGEDGSLQGLFESLNVKYVGAKVLASAVCMDKIISKKILEQANINIVPYFEMYEKVTQKSMNNIKLWAENKYPVFVKPSNMGSSVGISKVKNEIKLEDALELAFKYDSRILIEKGVNAREIECAVLESNGLIVSGVGEVISNSDFYDYDAKYLDDGNEKMQVPAINISKKIVEEIRAIAKIAFLAHGCNGLSRIDFFVENKTNKIIINEINTLPGMTSFSMYPSLFESEGISYTELIDKLIENALEY